MDRHFTVNSFFAWGGWLLGIVIVAACLALDDPELGFVGLMFAGAGGVLHIRGMLCEMSHRERAAFDLGRESVRSIR